ncbi:DNA alkylation repair protein [Sphingobacterium multivorum]|uniref:DNA alkylation repair protein n=1 Tax=Sphingobacterium multivorum TaxID=28454 RepID=UPI003019E3E6
MDKITSKVQIREIVAAAKQQGQQSGIESFMLSLQACLLKKKVRFPLLEFAAREIMLFVPETEQLHLTDRLIATTEMGSYVLTGIILQQRLPEHFEQSIHKACTYITIGNQWYVCDIIGERVLGHALLTSPKKAIPLLKELAHHSDKWIVRTIGVATHYAVKKGLSATYVNILLKLLISLSNTTDFHVKKGIGWGAKTIAKFHPDLVNCYSKAIESPETKQWFRTKITIGLNRHNLRTKQNRQDDTTIHLNQ